MAPGHFELRLRYPATRTSVARRNRLVSAGIQNGRGCSRIRRYDNSVLVSREKLERDARIELAAKELRFPCSTTELIALMEPPEGFEPSPYQLKADCSGCCPD